MLPQAHRVRSSQDFQSTVRSGARMGRRNVVLYAHFRQDQPSRFGFIVSKAVGNAVHRNLVKRRLRAISAQLLRKYPREYDVVVRALPASAAAPFTVLEAEVASAVGAATAAARKKQARSVAVTSGSSGG
ncbi:ribonuclease P protein component [Zhihengliuella flava]|uniref:Ribonuclease P protein component n=1 Tax=Zhihengliuella flava TaxID=1285193 RepID=A0A931D984_9MICC|nr:ribonuclease P protein component [Zhihengliuella flava]MBG6084699.1 ribonuclease P protein component [Zhihengliuella flava]